MLIIARLLKRSDSEVVSTECGAALKHKRCSFLIPMYISNCWNLKRSGLCQFRLVLVSVQVN